MKSPYVAINTGDHKLEFEIERNGSIKVILDKKKIFMIPGWDAASMTPADLRRSIVHKFQVEVPRQREVETILRDLIKRSERQRHGRISEEVMSGAWVLVRDKKEIKRFLKKPSNRAILSSKDELMSVEYAMKHGVKLKKESVSESQMNPKVAKLVAKYKKLKTDDYQNRKGDYPQGGMPDSINVVGWQNEFSINLEFKNTSENIAIHWTTRLLGADAKKFKITAAQTGDYHNDWVTVTAEIIV